MARVTSYMLSFKIGNHIFKIQYILFVKLKIYWALFDNFENLSKDLHKKHLNRQFSLDLS